MNKDVERTEDDDLLASLERIIEDNKQPLVVTPLQGEHQSSTHHSASGESKEAIMLSSPNSPRICSHIDLTRPDQTTAHSKPKDVPVGPSLERPRVLSNSNLVGAPPPGVVAAQKKRKNSSPTRRQPTQLKQFLAPGVIVIISGFIIFFVALISTGFIRIKFVPPTKSSSYQQGLRNQETKRTEPPPAPIRRSSMSQVGNFEKETNQPSKVLDLSRLEQEIDPKTKEAATAKLLRSLRGPAEETASQNVVNNAHPQLEWLVRVGSFETDVDKEPLAAKLFASGLAKPGNIEWREVKSKESGKLELIIYHSTMDQGFETSLELKNEPLIEGKDVKVERNPNYQH